MNKENEFNLNLSYNSEDKVSIISISNKSKSNSSYNQNTIKRPKKLNNKIISNQNSSSFSINYKKIKKKNSKGQNSSSFYTFTQNSNNKHNISDGKKEKTESKKSGEKTNLENKTPKKKTEKMNITLEKFEFKKKDLLTIDNINGKNLMDYFEKMNENIATEEKIKDRISSAGKKLTNSFKLKNTVINANKSWNKNNYFFMISQKPLKIINKKKENKDNHISKILFKKKDQSINSHNISPNIKNLQILLNQNNINIDLKNLIDKYRPNKILKKRINNNAISADKTIDDKNLKFDKIKKTPKSDSKDRISSFSYLKSRESTKKNLFNDFNKINDEMTNINKYINKNERKPNEKIYEKNKFFSTHFQLNKNNNLIINPKKKESNEIKNKQKIGNFFLKYKEKLETDKNKKSGI